MCIIIEDVHILIFRPLSYNFRNLKFKPFFIFPPISPLASRLTWPHPLIFIIYLGRVKIEHGKLYWYPTFYKHCLSFAGSLLVIVSIISPAERDNFVWSLIQPFSRSYVKNIFVTVSIWEAGIVGDKATCGCDKLMYIPNYDQ